MFKYVLKRIGYMFITLFFIATITFMFMHAMPGNPLAGATEGRKLSEEVLKDLTAKYGLDKPVSEQYVIFLKNLAKGDLGQSINFPGRTVTDMLKQGLPASARIGLQGLAFGVIFGVILGVVAAFNRGKWPDGLIIFIAFLGISIPNFVYAALLQYVFSVKLKMFPISGWGTFKHTVLPSFAMGLSSFAIYTRYMRTSCLDVINQDYVLTAKAKGVSGVSLVWKHIIRNAILPIITMLGPQIGSVITGSLVIESIFAIPGFGNSFTTAIMAKDFTLIMGFVIIFSTIYIVALLIVDILYSIVDPRIRLSSASK